MKVKYVFSDALRLRWMAMGLILAFILSLISNYGNIYYTFIFLGVIFMIGSIYWKNLEKGSGQ